MNWLELVKKKIKICKNPLKNMQVLFCILVLIE